MLDDTNPLLVASPLGSELNVVVLGEIEVVVKKLDSFLTEGEHISVDPSTTRRGIEGSKCEGCTSRVLV